MIIDIKLSVESGNEKNFPYIQRENQLIQQYLQQYGHLPEGGGDDLHAHF
ncbi:MAG: hypothetical protein ACOX1X_06720 [Dethiobacteria bacterium]